MSLITEAWKTAQREKQRRESDAGTPVAPVLVPLRTQSRSSFDWGRALTIAVSGLVIVVALALMARRLREPATLPALPPAPSPLAGSPLLAEPSALPSATPAPRLRIPTPIGDSFRPVTAASAPVTRSPNAPASPIVRQADAAAAPAPASANAIVRQTGRLRIALDEPRAADAAGLFAEALVAHRAGDLRSARALYERVLAIAPNDADALNNLGVLLSAQGELDRALQLLRRAASIAPANAGTWNNIGAVLRELGRSSDATAAFQHALSLDPEQERAKVGLAQQYISAGEWAQARALLESVIARNPSQAEAQYALGQTLEMLDDRGGAIRAFKAFILVAPPRLAAHVQRVRQHVDSLESASR